MMQRQFKYKRDAREKNTKYPHTVVFRLFVDAPRLLRNNQDDMCWCMCVGVWVRVRGDRPYMRHHTAALERITYSHPSAAAAAIKLAGVFVLHPLHNTHTQPPSHVIYISIVDTGFKRRVCARSHYNFFGPRLIQFARY